MLKIGNTVVTITVNLHCRVILYNIVNIMDPIKKNMFSAEVNALLSFGSPTSPAYARLGELENPIANAIRIELAYSISMFLAKYNMN